MKLSELLPPLTTEEFAALKADLKANGQLHPILVDEHGDILDGAHRNKILGKNAKRKVIRGLSEGEKKAFVFRSNFSRRNLSGPQKTEARKIMKATAKELREEDKRKWTQPRLATVFGVTQQCVSKWQVITSNTNGCITCNYTPDARVKVPPDNKPTIANRVKDGETQTQVAADYGVSPQQVSNICKQQNKIHSRDNDKQRKTAKLKKKAFDLRKGDFRKVLKDIEGVSLILTDPPYGKDAIPLWRDLGKFAAKALHEDGILIAYSGQMYLPQVLTELSKSLTYWWCGAVIHKGSGNLTPLGHPVRKVINQWKPLVMFVRKNGVGYQETFRDLIRGTGPEKDKHNWQQPEAEAGEMVKAFTKKGDLVVDPFAGSGGFCKAAKDLGRIAIGAEILNG